MSKVGITSTAFIFVAMSLCHAASRPREVDKIMSDFVSRQDPEEECKHAKAREGFQTTRDLNADGLPDYIFDFCELVHDNGFRCLSWANGGCRIQIILSNKNGKYSEAFEGGIQEYRLEKRFRKYIIRAIDLHGSYCGKTGVAECSGTISFKGNRAILKTR